MLTLSRKGRDQTTLNKAKTAEDLVPMNKMRGVSGWKLLKGDTKNRWFLGKLT